MNAYVITGAVFAVFAVLISLAGMRGFPSSAGGQRLAMGLAAVLFVAAVGSAIADTTKVGERKGKEVEEKPAAETGPSSPPPASSTSSTPQASTPPPASSGGGGGAASDLALAADPTGQLKFDKTALDAKAGPVKITLTNASAVPHNISVKGTGVDAHSPDISGGKTADVTANLKAGTYTFYCSIPGHEQAGMKGTLTVK
jgi:plastocyanin